MIETRERERQEEDRRMKILGKERTDIGLLCVVVSVTLARNLRWLAEELVNMVISS